MPMDFRRPTGFILLAALAYASPGAGHAQTVDLLRHEVPGAPWVRPGVQVNPGTHLHMSGGNIISLRFEFAVEARGQRDHCTIWYFSNVPFTVPSLGENDCRSDLDFDSVDWKDRNNEPIEGRVASVRGDLVASYADMVAARQETNDDKTASAIIGKAAQLGSLRNSLLSRRPSSSSHGASAQPPQTTKVSPGSKSAMCESYAKRAVQQVSMAQQQACGVVGARWAGTYQDHFRACQAAAQPAFAKIEIDARDRHLRRCKPLLGFGVTSFSAFQAYRMQYDLAGCARLCEQDGRCVAWQLAGRASAYTCHLIDKVQVKPQAMGDTFFGFGTRYNGRFAPN